MWWLSLILNLTILGINYNPEMDSTSVRDFLVNLKWVHPFPVWTFEVGGHIPLIQILQWEDTALNLDLDSGRHTPLIQILRQEGMMGHTFFWNTRKERWFALCLFALALLENPFPHWHWSLRLQDSNTYWRSVETPILVGLRNYCVLWLSIHS